MLNNDLRSVALQRDQHSFYLKQPGLLWIFFLACAVPLAFAVYTHHAWEDFYITLRASRNLATGEGLVFNVGDRLQTFTSPIQALLLALSSLLTGNGSDVAALWFYRALCIPAFGLAAALLFASTLQLRYPTLASVALMGWLVTDSKSIDFTINGMETPFLLLGFAYTFWAMFGAHTRAWLHLGVAWGFLMLARPDSFIYIGLFAGAVFLFNQPEMTGRDRDAWLQLFLRAVPVAAVLYLPWFLFAWSYYGSPVPHTIVAKGVQAGSKTLVGFVQFYFRHPLEGWLGSAASQDLFMPEYVTLGGWPVRIRMASQLAAIACAVAWVMPGLRTETKAASFTLLGSLLYLSYFPPATCPWYLCLPAVFGFLTMSGLLAQVLAVAPKIASSTATRLLRFSLVVVWLTTLLLGIWLSVQSAKQLKLQQAIIENGTRREIGAWLREHAAPGDAVLLEPLGYVGYFSGLKTYDVPGLSSREVVELERRGLDDLGTIAAELHPEWLVLRPHEIAAISETHPHLLDGQYIRAREFNVRDSVTRLPIYGRGYLEFNSAFTIFHRRLAG
jgi:hypothetical protein